MAEGIDSLAQEIRRVDGAHSLGAGALSEALQPWLAAHDREVAAKALREAAEATEQEAPGEDYAGATFTAHARWLRAEADRIESQASEKGAVMVSSNDVTIADRTKVALVPSRDDGFQLSLTAPDDSRTYGVWLSSPEAAALRAHFAAERLPEDVQALVDEARRWAGGSTTSLVGANLVQDLAAALRTAQRPPVSPEVREAAIDCVQRAIWESHIGTLSDAEWAIARNQHGVMAIAREQAALAVDALLARFSFPSRPEVSPEALADVIHEKFNEVRGRLGVVPRDLADAILAQLSVPSRPEVSPELREEIEAVVQAEDERWDGSNSSEDFSTRVADALLARFSFLSQPVYDDEKVAIWFANHAYPEGYAVTEEDEATAAALVAALPTLRADG